MEPSRDGEQPPFAGTLFGGGEDRPDVLVMPPLLVRPAPPSGPLGRRIRRIAGVDEDILDWVPEERRRYTWVGLIVINTGVFAGASLLSAMNRFLGVSWYLLLLPALVWAWAIMCLDGLLITSSHGRVTGGLWRVLLPRLALSVLMGLFIAEPLVLRVFQPAIHQEVQEQRLKDIGDFQDRLHRCNPYSGERLSTGECLDNPVTVRNPPLGAQQRLTDATAERDKLKAVVADLKKQKDEKEALSHDECTGRPVTGTTGRAGEGPNCLRDREEADRTTAKYAEQQQKLDALDAQVITLIGDAGTATRTYTEQVSAEIDKAVAARKATQGRIDILEEGSALQRLADRSLTVRVNEWLLRLLLIVLDCLPVLVKVMNGTTAYDRRVARQLAADESVHNAQKDLEERHGVIEAELRRQRLEHEYRERIKALHQADADKEARDAAEVDARIEALAARFRRQGSRAGRTPVTDPDLLV
ncbi:DUF4407 domain-containing protein [Kitasatospora sp. GP82]|uniref:DUF4407 domain-containing protein n=1 Tax=Kitasatospora sp. GP82 TaxID=3035089 RepID=UPI00247475B6|nr:DUF4407 domain-containing protein [Kitasatospora sp. GP82]